jgi:RNase P protein component
VIVDLLGRIEPGWDVLIIARPASAQASQAELGAVLERLMLKAGLIAPQVAA